MDLPLSTVYSLFYSRDVDIDSSYPQCDNISTLNQSNLCECSSLCKKTENALKFLHGMINTNILDNNSKWCEYLSYFINDNIKNSKFCNDPEELYTELDNLKIYYSPLNNNCTIQKFTIDKEDFINKKKLYILGEILHWIEVKYEYISEAQKNLYNKFFGECVNIYKDIVYADNCEKKEEYETELNNLIDNFNNTKKFLSTKDVSITYEDLKFPNASPCQKELNGMQEEDVPDRGAARGVNEEEGYTGSEGDAQEGALAKPSLLQVSGTRDGIQGPVVSMSDSDPGLRKEYSDDNMSSPVGTIIGTSLGFVVPLITIYKFTPLGSWINTKVLGRNKILKNMERNNQHLLLNSTENGEINLGDTMYHIKYNS
ncbi:VIR protein [Plasmodium vivax]|uniref:VIR protein n=1 Tax=Plasmodium vivax TaxID=5855 RepID=A0A1G4E2J1_PLAVI|nr:VIR protein [Plasmodium vivax]